MQIPFVIQEPLCFISLTVASAGKITGRGEKFRAMKYRAERVSANYAITAVEEEEMQISARKSMPALIRLN